MLVFGAILVAAILSGFLGFLFGAAHAYREMLRRLRQFEEPWPWKVVARAEYGTVRMEEGKTIEVERA